MARVIVGLSGGVDSAVAALLLKEQGYDVIGVTLRTWQSDYGSESRCCEIDDARATADVIGIPYHVFNCLSEFDEKVIKPFIDDYIHGITPNPCVVCNREVKWERLLYHANVLQADFIATGHYASVVKLDNGRYTVKQASHIEKDQTYMLYRLSQEQLSRTLMPLSDMTKEEVREIAVKAGIPVAGKPDSQEICFAADDDYAGFIERETDGNTPPEGNFIDENGTVLGRHKGIIHYTVGQRKGLGIAVGHPVFVKEIKADTNEVVLVDEDALYATKVTCRSLNFMGIEKIDAGEELTCNVKLRYRHKAQPATVRPLGEDRVEITFDSPVKAPTPGQSAVFYDDDGCVLAGGIIE